MSSDSSEFREMEENFETLTGLYNNMLRVILYHEKEQENYETAKKDLEDSNKLLRESNDKLLRVNEEQRTMLGTLDECKGKLSDDYAGKIRELDKINLQTIELDDVKKENIQLKDSINNKLQNVQQPCSVLDASSLDTLEVYNASLQDNIVDLEKQILAYQNTACLKVSNTNVYDFLTQVSKFKVKFNTLEMEYKLLNEQLLKFRNMHNQIITETKLNILSNANDVSRLERTTDCTSAMIFDENDLKPLQVNIIDSYENESVSPLSSKT